MPRRDGEGTLEKALKAAGTLQLKTPATRLELDIAYKRAVNRFARYLASHGIVGKRSWRLYKPYWRAYELLQKYILLVQAGWKYWEEVPTAAAAVPEPVGEEEQPPKPPDVLDEDGAWQRLWGGVDYWSQTDGDKEGEALDEIWKEVREDISKP